MLKIWSEWQNFQNVRELKLEEALIIYFQRDEQTPWNCAISSKSLNNPVNAENSINAALEQMINNSFPEYWTPKAKALRKKDELLHQLKATDEFLESIGDENG